ncbi:hypothetical protein D3C86_2117590 [compost metagenome]
MENGRAVARIEAEMGVQSVGYILRLNDWEEKSADGDRFIDCSGSEKLIKVLVRERRPSSPGNAHDPVQLSS